MRRSGLIKELCRVFHAKPVAILCALRHRQITVDGYEMREEFDLRWGAKQLKGRMAAIHYHCGSEPRRARLYE